MASNQKFVDFVLEQIENAGEITAKKMFGEYALYVGGKVVALACDNSLYVKPTQAIQKLAIAFATKPPYPGAKPHVVVDELLDDSDSLKKILLETASALPTPKAKVAKKSRERK